jgi:hypothetical protein
MKNFHSGMLNTQISKRRKVENRKIVLKEVRSNMKLNVEDGNKSGCKL